MNGIFPNDEPGADFSVFGARHVRLRLVPGAADARLRFAQLLAALRDVEPLEMEPHFATPLAGLRLHLLRAAPVPFERRNIFIDSSLGDRV